MALAWPTPHPNSRHIVPRDSPPRSPSALLLRPVFLASLSSLFSSSGPNRIPSKTRPPTPCCSGFLTINQTPWFCNAKEALMRGRTHSANDELGVQLYRVTRIQSEHMPVVQLPEDRFRKHTPPCRSRRPKLAVSEKEHRMDGRLLPAGKASLSASQAAKPRLPLHTLLGEKADTLGRKPSRSAPALKAG
jgi:hypothetical protein